MSQKEVPEFLILEYVDILLESHETSHYITELMDELRKIQRYNVIQKIIKQKAPRITQTVLQITHDLIS